MKIEFINNTPHISPETTDEEDQLFLWYEKQKGKNIEAVISFEWFNPTEPIDECGLEPESWGGGFADNN